MTKRAPSEVPSVQDRDAYWRVRSIAYVSSEPPLATSLFDDPEGLNDSLDTAHASLIADANETDEERDQVIARSQEILGEFALR